MLESETLYLFLSTLFVSTAILTFFVVMLFCLTTLTRLVRRSFRRWRRAVSY